MGQSSDDIGWSPAQAPEPVQVLPLSTAVDYAGPMTGRPPRNALPGRGGADLAWVCTGFGGFLAMLVWLSAARVASTADPAREAAGLSNDRHADAQMHLMVVGGAMFLAVLGLAVLSTVLVLRRRSPPTRRGTVRAVIALNVVFAAAAFLPFRLFSS
jgi:hypothetical protein